MDRYGLIDQAGWWLRSKDGRVIAWNDARLARAYAGALHAVRPLPTTITKVREMWDSSGDPE